MKNSMNAFDQYEVWFVQEHSFCTEVMQLSQ